LEGRLYLEVHERIPDSAIRASLEQPSQKCVKIKSTIAAIRETLGEYKTERSREETHLNSALEKKVFCQNYSFLRNIASNWQKIHLLQKERE
jgi:hypothetical protein